MKFSVPKNALIVIADGHHAKYFRNHADSGIKLEKTGELSPGDHDKHGAGPLPPETSLNEMDDAAFARQLADDLYKQVHKGGIDALVLIADPQTLGQIRPSLHPEVTKRITGELHKTLVKSPLADIEHILTTSATA